MGHDVLRDWLMTLCIRLRGFFLSKRIFEDKSGKAVSGFVELALLCCNNLLCLIKSLHTLRLVAIVLNSNYLAVNSVLQVTYVTWACSLRVITLEWVLKFSCSLRIYTYLNLFKIKLDQQHFLLSAPQLCVLVINRVTLPNQDWAMGPSVERTQKIVRKTQRSPLWEISHGILAKACHLSFMANRILNSQQMVVKLFNPREAQCRSALI